MTMTEIARLFKDIEALWPGKFKIENQEDAMKLWQKIFNNVNAELVNKALLSYVCEGSAFTPSASELMARVIEVSGSNHPSPVAAWAKVGHAIRFYGPNCEQEAKELIGGETLAWKAVERLGGWDTVCHCAAVEEFMNAYRQTLKEAARHMLEGNHETDSSN